MLQSWSARMEAAGIASLCEGSSDIVCFADREKLRQVLDNLVQNAIEEAHRGNGKIAIRTSSVWKTMVWDFPSKFVRAFSIHSLPPKNEELDLVSRFLMKS
jgi:hypothetical protein